MSFLNGLLGSRSVQVTVGENPSSSPAPTPRPIATYRSTADGTMHSIEITSLSDHLDSPALGVVRASLERDFGAVAATHALRLVQGLPEGEKVTGQHVVEANLAALEFVAPGLRLAGDKLRAEGKLATARSSLTAAEQNLAKLEREQAELRGEHATVLEDRNWSPYLSSRLTEITEQIELAKTALHQARVDIDGCEADLAQATEAVDRFTTSLNTPVSQGDDLTRLTERVSQLSDERDAAIMSFDTAKAAYDRCKTQYGAELAERYKDSSYTLPSRDFQLARERLDDTSQVLAQRGERVANLTTKLETAQGQLDALRFGPVSRNFQVALDHVGADDRFMTIIDSLAPGKATGGGLGTAEKHLANLSPTRSIPYLAKTVVVPLKLADTFRQAIKAEDCERRLMAASKSLDDHPIAKALTMSLASSKETEKWKLGIAGTIGFVGFALSAPGGSAIGALSQPATSLIQHAVSGGVDAAIGSLTGPLQGTVVSGLQPLLTSAVSGKIAAAPFQVGSQIGSQVGQLGIEKLGGVGPDESTGKRAREMLEAVEPLPGTSMPTIPVRSVGLDQEAPSQLSLADPEVTVALLTYLGPKADPARLNHPGRREAELRRIEIRSNFFGAQDGDDFTAGTSVRGGTALIEALEGGVNAPPIPEGVSPLQLMMTGVGLIG